MRPRPGDVLLVDGRASVRFAGDRALLLRVIAVSGRPTYPGWCWLTGYVVDASGRAVDRREVFVQPAGLRLIDGGTRQRGERSGRTIPMLLR